MIYPAGVVGHIWHAPSLTSFARLVEAETLPYEKLCCLFNHRYYGLIRLLDRLRSDFHFSLYPHFRLLLATCQALPCFIEHFPSIPLPICRRVLQGCSSRFFTPSVAFTAIWTARLSLVKANDTAGFPLMVRTAGLHLILWDFIRFDVSGRPVHQDLAIWLSGDYQYRTFTDEHSMPCKAHQFVSFDCKNMLYQKKNGIWLTRQVPQTWFPAILLKQITQRKTITGW